MKQNLDQLMEARNLDALVASGKIHGNPALYYLTGGAGMTSAILVKRRGEPATLIAGPMEREEAAATGLDVVVSSRYEYASLLREHSGDLLAADVSYYQRIFADLGVQGRMGFYGLRDQGQAYTFLHALQQAIPELEIANEYASNVLTAARATKDAAEVARIREAGRLTASIVEATVDFLREQRVGDDEILRQADGAVLNVGAVHAHIRRLVGMHGLEDPEGFIFATGRDAGIPHSKGTPAAPLRLGESIVFDIFPCEAGGGYFFDMTRTFCLGYAPEPVQQLYDEVHACLQHIGGALAVGEETRRYQQLTCAFFRERGHPTIAEDPKTLEGYVHSVSHGLGLELHEAPTFRDTTENTARLERGHVFTVEPGLYYPERGMGARLEDVFWCDGDGVFHNLTEFPFELVIPVG